MNNKNEIVIKVLYKDKLLNYILDNYKLKSKNNIKTYLKNGNILVNNKKITEFDYLVNINDSIVIRLNSINNSLIDIIYEDNDLIAVNKPSGLLTIASLKEKEKTLYHYVSNYIKSKNKKNKIFIVHRLDKDTSGIVLFAKNEIIKSQLQNNWDRIVKVRNYVAVVNGNTLDKGVVESYLKEDKTLRVYSTNDKSGMHAKTEYRKLSSNKKYSLLNILIYTGKKNQIRVHMCDINHPIVGDKKYGLKKSPINRMCLHFNILEFINPVNHKKMHFEIETPKEFYNLVK